MKDYLQKEIEDQALKLIDRVKGSMIYGEPIDIDDYYQIIVAVYFYGMIEGESHKEGNIFVKKEIYDGTD